MADGRGFSKIVTANFVSLIKMNNPDFGFDVRNGRINRKNTANFSREENNYESTGENFRDLFDYF